MKNWGCLLLLAGVLLFTSCTKTETETDPASLTGKWKLVQTLIDIGDGSGTWQPVAGPDQRLLLFTPQNHLAGDAFPQARSYEIVNKTTLKFLYADGTYINYNYNRNADTLVLSGGGCIEACGLKFENTNAYN